jgi:hypothetical protein
VRTLIERMEAENEELMFLEPRATFDECVLGVVERCGQEACVLYSEAKVLAALVQSGMDLDDAEEHFDCNILGSYVGEKTPMYLRI